METKFQTSFIPRTTLPATPGSLAPQAPKKVHTGGVSIYLTLAIVIFVASLLAVAGIYGWKQYMLSSQTKYEAALVLLQEDFNIDQISLIKSQATKIALAKRVLANHLAASKIFSVISGLTSESVRFLSMDLAVPVGTPGPLELTLSGYGRDLPTVAFQSDVLNQLDKYGLRTVVKNAIVSDPSLNKNGTVSFGFTAEVDPSTFSYAKNLGASGSIAPVNVVSPPAGTITATSSGQSGTTGASTGTSSAPSN